MEEHVSSYRPHNPGHDYYAPGIYLITLVVRNRRENAGMFGCLNDELKAPGAVLSEVGKAVMRCWEEIPAFEKGKGREVKIHAAVCMPDHFHGVIEVKERMDVSLGQVIWGFKVACTKEWRRLANAQGMVQPRTAARGEATAAGGEVTAARGEAKAAGGEAGEDAQPSLVALPDLHRMSKKQRAQYYALHPEAQQPLWDDNYDDTICLTDPVTGEYCQRHFAAMVRYVEDNARRAILRRLRPQFMQRCLHVRIGAMDAQGQPMLDAQGMPVMRDYAAFGNLFLLRWARKVQVFCHRKARFGQLTEEERRRHGYTCAAVDDMATRVPYETTDAFRREHDAWVAQVLAGATVIVTPGISKGEQAMKDECLAKGYPMIHLQKEPIGAYWKPEARRFDACARGSLLILAPWKAEELGEVNGVPADSSYSMFHNLNRLAEEICLFDGEAVVKGGG